MAFLVIDASVLWQSATEEPSVPLKTWILGYLVQGMIHSLYVLVEFRRRMMSGTNHRVNILLAHLTPCILYQPHCILQRLQAKLSADGHNYRKPEAATRSGAHEHRSSSRLSCLTTFAAETSGFRKRKKK
ncbi:hypothetical protein LR48_Vigan06g093700 [Vigna angularis]|uniref:Uncharacterized protein n=1 Tax=Phaseolus angularis TaxID=3914 RepID=A0A0L9USC9_PHAAN|nr:hypothetical protein LR48_Vigan06g093700 [Vigna angularis]